jgi:CheY-like chemotaxis protein
MARILLSEADPDVRRLLVVLLERSGHTTIVLDGGISVPPPADLLLLDPSSEPRVQQAEIAREHNPALPVVSLSALPANARFLTRGPLFYLPKPFTLEQLRSTLESALALG